MNKKKQKLLLFVKRVDTYHVQKYFAFLSASVH